MRLIFLPANQAWVFVFGQNLATASIQAMDGQTFFPSRAQAVLAANRRGLSVAQNGTVTR